MRAKYIIISLLLLPFYIMAQSADQSYILTREYHDETQTSFLDQIQYFDGLGRPLQTIEKNQTPLHADLISMKKYDSQGREVENWLPVVIGNNNGAFNVYQDFVNSSMELYYPDERGYVETTYEHTPWNRFSYQYNPGYEWGGNGKVNSIDYLTNNANEAMLFEVSDDNLIKNTSYIAGQLYVTKATDEDNHIVLEYKDKDGRVLLKRAQAEDGNHDTYYVYNDLGQLSYVLSPEASDKLAGFTGQLSMPNTITTSTDAYTKALWQLAYHYQYDDKGNCKYKKLPGCEPIYMLYDKDDRMVLSQDGNQRSVSEWSFTKYDVLGRVIQTGKATNPVANSTELATLRTKYNTDLIVESYDTGSGYKNDKSMGTNPIILTQNYYDTYDYLSIPAYVSSNYDLGYKDFSLSGFDSKYSSAQGLLTGKVTAMLDNSMNLITALYYDDKGRVVQTRATNHLGGYDYEFFHYNFTGKALNKRHIHKALTNAEITENYRFTYDHADRLTGEYHKLNTQPEATLATMTYDELGRMDQKILHGGIQTIKYTYNIRNWLKSISSPKFSETLYYQDSPYGGQCYNGNISAQVFGTTIDKLYIFSYDKLNRLKSATNSSDEFFAENIGNYDKNGNIKQITRNGGLYDYSGYNTVNGVIDELTLEYNGNQLKSVSDAAVQSSVATTNDFVDKQDAAYPTEYLYDANGNQTADLNKGVAWIRYNLLNLPQKVQFRNRTKNEYLYDASGVKHTAKYNYSTSTSLIPLGGTTQENTLASTFQIDYCGNYVYEKTGTANPVLKRILTPEGYVQTMGTTPMNYMGYWQYVYPLKDHLGNTRVNLTSYYLSSNTNKNYSASGQIDYYPFGMERSTNDPRGLFNSGTNPYLYNGKEIDRLNGLNEYDYGARWNNPAVGGWSTPDPLCEKRYSISPYVYCSGDPVNRRDTDGRDEFLLIWATANGEFGHAALAVSNYNDKNEPNGTYTFYELGPGKGASLGLSNFNQNVNAYYSTENTNNQEVRKSELISNVKDNSSLSAYEKGAANGIIQIKTNYSQDSRAKTALENWENKNSEYNGVKNNCTVYATVGISAAVGKVIDAREIIKTGDHIVKTYTPNYLYREVNKLPNTTIIQNPGNNVNNSFLEGKAGSLEKFITKYW